jgi:hypothetical protein
MAESLGSTKSPDFVVLKARLLPCNAGRRPAFSFDAARRYAEPGNGELRMMNTLNIIDTETRRLCTDVARNVSTT